MELVRCFGGNIAPAARSGPNTDSSEFSCGRDSNSPHSTGRAFYDRCFEHRSSDLLRAESRTLSIFQALGLQLHFANQARHRTCGPFPSKKKLPLSCFRRIREQMGDSRGERDSLIAQRTSTFRPNAGYRRLLNSRF